ncbi:MAG: flavodoxin family protein [Bacteroidota bacterium]
MKYLVTYWSQTGNTKKVAEAIFAALPGEKTLKPFDEIETLEGFDLTFIGYPIKQFGLPQAAKKFITAYADGKTIAVFVTHAMMTQSDDQQQQFLLARELDKCRTACLKSNLIGLFHCQGELSEKTANDLLASNIPTLMEFAAMRPHTVGHPNREELVQAKDFARTITRNFIAP